MEDLDISSRTYLEKTPEIKAWLLSKIFDVFLDEEIEAWLIGSIINDSLCPQDCDVLIMLQTKCVTQLAQVSSAWKQEFEERFGLPLHLTRITYDEAESCCAFLEAVFSKRSVQIKPNVHDAS